MEQVLLDVLKDSNTQTISFMYVGTTGFVFRVVPGDFTTVALAIQNDRIAVQEGGASAGKARYTIRNDGKSKANTFYIGKNNTTAAIFNSLLVHESVHAIFDLKGISMPWLDNEAIAYIAQGFYLFNAGQKTGVAEEAFYGMKAAGAIQDSFKFKYWVEMLRNALLNDPFYHDYIGGTFEGDG